MNALMLLANGFEDHEALTTRDILVRSGIGVTTASVTDELIVTTSHKLKVIADTVLTNIDTKHYDCLIIPGGKAGVLYLKEMDLEYLFKAFIEKDKWIAAICAGPSLLGKYNLLQGKKFTCFPGFEPISQGEYHKELGVVEDGKIITGKSMYYTIDFTIALLGAFGYDKKEITRKLKGE